MPVGQKLPGRPVKPAAAMAGQGASWHNRSMQPTRRPTLNRIAVFTAAFALICAEGAAALADGFAPHRAVYRTTMVSARGGSGIADVSGQLAAQWRKDCQGWTFEYRSVLNITLAEGPPLRLASHATSWESLDGRRYNFTMRHVSNGKEAERIEGAATLAADGSGTVRFTSPTPREIKLPRGTLFPTAHSEAVLAAAAGLKGVKTLSRVVFDGMGDEGPMALNALMTPHRAKPEADKALPKPLAGMASYNTTMAYFDLGAASAEPTHEMAMRLFANGVGDGLVLDFKDFTVRGALTRLDMLDAPSCGR
jgi:hypothetical protein